MHNPILLIKNLVSDTLLNQAAPVIAIAEKAADLIKAACRKN